MKRLLNLFDRVGASDEELKSESAFKDFKKAREKLNANVESLSDIIDRLNREQLHNLNLSQNKKDNP